MVVSKGEKLANGLGRIETNEGLISVSVQPIVSETVNETSKSPTF